MLVDTSGLLRQVVVTAADVDDRDGLQQVLTRLGASGVARLRKLWDDGGYRGETIRTWVANVKKTHKIYFPQFSRYTLNGKARIIA